MTGLNVQYINLPNPPVVPKIELLFNGSIIPQIQIIDIGSGGSISNPAVTLLVDTYGRVYIGGNNVTGSGSDTASGFNPVSYNSGNMPTTGDDGIIIIAETTVEEARMYMNGVPVSIVLQNNVYDAPTTGFTYNFDITNTFISLVLNPSSTIANGTIILPDTPMDGQTIEVLTSQDITTLTVSPNTGQTILNAPITLGANTGFSYRYVAAVTTWFRRF